MSHVRTQIRDEIVSILTGLTTSGARVYESFPYVLDPAVHLPGLVVSTPDEERVAEFDVTRNAKQIRDLTLTVTAHEKAISGAEDTIDTMCAEVESAIYTAAFDVGSTLHSLIKVLNYVGVEITKEFESDQPTIMATMTWSIRYRVDGVDPETVIE